MSICSAEYDDADAPMPGRYVERRILSDTPPSNKAALARFMAELYDYETDRTAEPLPNLDEFLNVLARPRWEWTRKAGKTFRRIRRIRNQEWNRNPTIFDLLNEARGGKKRPLIRQQLQNNNRRRCWAAAVPASESTLTSACTVGSIDVSSDAPTNSTACTTTIDRKPTK